jgi:hypothetical protein
LDAVSSEESIGQSGRKVRAMALAGAAGFDAGRAVGVEDLKDRKLDGTAVFRIGELERFIGPRDAAHGAKTQVRVEIAERPFTESG